MSDQETTGQALDLDAIEASAKGFVDERQIRRILSRDVPALVAEVRNLRAEIARRDAADEFREGCEDFARTFGDGP